MRIPSFIRGLLKDSDYDALREELEQFKQRERWHLEHIMSYEPKRVTLFPDDVPVIPMLQLRYFSLIQPDVQGVPAELPNDLTAVQHRLAHHINELLAEYDKEGKEARPLTRMREFFVKLRIANTDADTREGKIFSGLQACVQRVSDNWIFAAASAEFGPLCNTPALAFDFLNMLESTEIFRLMQLKDRLLKSTTFDFSSNKQPA